MVVIPRNCDVCKTEFELHFRYQMEERSELAESGETVTRYAFYCSQRCLEASHTGRSDGQVPCDACATRFTVDLAAQVLFTGGRRHYACSNECRTRILHGARSVRLGELRQNEFELPGDAEPLPEPSDSMRLTERAPALPPAIQPLPRLETPPPASMRRESNVRRLRPGKPQVLAVFNHKGGTGKTTTAVHVAGGLAERGHKVLLVDTDGQGNVATSLALTPERSLYHVIVMGLSLEQAVVQARPNLDVLPANETLAAAELYLAGQKRRDRVLAQRLEGARGLYDYVIVDCSPSLSLMNQNALAFADAVLCPVACDYLSLVGVRQVLRTIKQVNRILGHAVQLWGVLPTQFDTRARICREALETLRQNFGDVCLSPIHYVSRVKEAPSVGKTLFEYAPTSTATEDYWRVVEKLLSSTASAANTAEAQAAEQAGGAK
ncbi:MAG TPA: ParA family protein [Polyangiaceae bacterium]